MQREKTGEVRRGLVYAVFVVLFAGMFPALLSASASGRMGIPSQGLTGGGQSFFHFEPTESFTVRGISDAGKRISENVGFIGGEIPGMLGTWAGKGAFMNITYLNLLTSLVLLLAVFVFNKVIKTYIDGKVRQILQRQRHFSEMGAFWDALSKPLSLFILIYGTFLALAPVLVELKKVEGMSLAYLVAGKAADFAGYIAIFWFIYRLVNVMEAFLRKKVLKTDTTLDDTIVPLLGRTTRIFIVIIGTAIVVKNLTGLDFGPLLASLGIGGMAVAFAAKDSIGNFLGSLTILFDKPFTVGDRIVIDGRDGVVEELGFRSTRIRTASGSLVSIPNEKIINTMVENVGRRPALKWSTTLFIAGDTSPAKAERAVEILRGILRDHEGMREDTPPKVHLNGFGEKSLTIAVTAWYHPSEGAGYEEWVQKTCLDVLRAFEAEGIEIIGGKPL
jgi:MscS family membrane protein